MDCTQPSNAVSIQITRTHGLSASTPPLSNDTDDQTILAPMHDMISIVPM